MMTECKTIKVDYKCDDCETVVQPTGLMQPSDPPHYEHKCPKCDKRYLLDKQYPHVRFDPVEA